ncbi:MAG: RNA polymerase sigma factor [Planctomycetes bacterium]|nr:RNA polymerase sigma factor [Planctomycetota bacterium]MCA8946359.1 RNA polymerase sigma factor [Planctomycetota bacterium]
MQTDTELVTRLADGDDAALEAILDAYQDAVVRFARTVTRDANTAHDAAQEAFIRLWRNPKSFSGGSLRAWLFTVARNVALNEFRSTRRRTARIEKAAQPPQPPTAVARASDAERLKQVREFIDTLPEQERSAITLFAAEGLTQQEVADVLGTSAGAVKQAVLSARSKLRERFGDSS